MRHLMQVALFIVTLAVVSHAQSDSGGESGVNFQGQIHYENNRPAQFVQVELWTDGESTWRSIVMTDRMGKFHTGAPCMIIQYKVNAIGFRPVQGRVDISIPPCRALEDITLLPLPGTATPAKEPPTGMIDARIAGIPPEAKSEFEAGRESVDKSDFTGAIPHLERAINLYPKYAEAYQLLGVAQIKNQQGQQAEASLVKAIEIEDRMPRAQYLLGLLYAMTGRANLAEKPLTRFAELEPNNPEAYFELAKVSFALKKFPTAEKQARKSIDLKEANAGVYVVLGYAQLRQNKANDARQSFQRFLKQDPTNAMSPDVKDTIAMIDSHAKQR